MSHLASSPLLQGLSFFANLQSETQNSQGADLRRLRSRRAAPEFMAFLVITYGLPLAFRLPMVKDHLSSSVISVDVEDNLQTVAQLLSGNRITGAPVVEDGTVIGILSRNDLLRAICTVPTDASDQVKEESLDKIRATKVGFMRSYRTPPDTTRTPKSPIASLTLTLAPTLTRSGRCARTSASL